MRRKRFPGVAAKLRAAETDVLAYLEFPVDHWRSEGPPLLTNPLTEGLAA
jgi:hypothetical protein